VDQDLWFGVVSATLADHQRHFLKAFLALGVMEMAKLGQEGGPRQSGVWQCALAYSHERVPEYHPHRSNP